MLHLSQYKTRIPAIIDDIVASYNETAATHHFDNIPLPRVRVVVDILDDLKEIIFPGYRNREQLHSSNAVYYIGNIVDRIHDRLTVLIERSLTRIQQPNGVLTLPEQENIQHDAEERTLMFLQQIPAIRSMLAKDVEAAYVGDPACKSSDEAILCYPGLEAVTVHRLAHALHKLRIPLIPRMMSEYAHSKTGIDIHPGANIGEYFFLDHGTGVVIGETTSIGSWVKLYQGVTLGAVSFPKDESGELIRSTKRHPTIEDNVVIYANATILGGKTIIGKGSTVGSNVWLIHSISPGTTITIEKPHLNVRIPQAETLDWQI
ncbi:serine acetyltransferase [Planctomycetales bacterium]|nr:serine acetyltransferase [Planctomycetales bacterium]